MMQIQMVERLILRRPSLASAAENLYVPRRPRQKEKLVFICNPSTGNKKGRIGRANCRFFCRALGR